MDDKPIGTIHFPGREFPYYERELRFDEDGLPCTDIRTAEGWFRFAGNGPVPLPSRPTGPKVGDDTA